MAAKFVRRSYAARAETARNPVAQDLFRLMERKQSNLAVAADVTRAEELLNIARTVGPYICVFKVRCHPKRKWTSAHGAIGSQRPRPCSPRRRHRPTLTSSMILRRPWPTLWWRWQRSTTF